MNSAYYVLYALGFFMGASLGSFVNMLTYRVYHKIRLGGRSFADDDKQTILKPIDQIPVISYLIFRGKSRTDGSKLPIYYPLVEFTSGVIVTFIFFHVFNNIENLFVLRLVSLVVFFTGLLFFASYDKQYMSLPKRELLLFSGSIIILILTEYLLGLRSIEFVNSGIVTAIIGATISGVIYVLPDSGLSKNDVVFTAVVALYLGQNSMLISSVIASIFGLGWGLVKIYQNKKVKVYVPYATIIWVGVVTYSIASWI